MTRRQEFTNQADSLTGGITSKTDQNTLKGHFHYQADEVSSYDQETAGFNSFLLQKGSDLVAPNNSLFAEVSSITDLVTGKSTPTEAANDLLVAAGPLDAMKVDEPQNNDF